MCGVEGSWNNSSFFNIHGEGMGGRGKRKEKRKNEWKYAIRGMNEAVS